MQPICQSSGARLPGTRSALEIPVFLLIYKDLRYIAGPLPAVLVRPARRRHIEPARRNATDRRTIAGNQSPAVCRTSVDLCASG